MSIASLTIDILGNSKNLLKELDKSGKRAGSWAKETRAAVNTAGKAFTGMAATVAAGLVAIYTATAQSSDALVKHADKLGINVVKLQELHYAGELTGVSNETMNMSLQRMTRRLAEAANGTGEAVKALDDLGLSAKDMANLSPDQQFAKIADAMGDIGTQSEKVRIAFKLFDSGGVGLVNTMALGSEGLAAAAREAEELGLTLNRIDLAKIEAANDEFFKAKEATEAFGKVLTAEVAPFVKALSVDFLNAAKEAGGFGNIATRVVDATLKSIGFFADSVRGIQILWKMTTLAVAAFGTSVAAIISTSSNILMDFINLIPGMNYAYSETLNGITESMANVTADIWKDLNVLLETPLPSEGIEIWAEKVKSAANIAAAAVAAAANGNVISEALIGPAVPTAKESTEAAKLKTENDKIVSLQAEKFRKITEMKLQNESEFTEIENRRWEREQAAFDADLIRLEERGLLTKEMKAKFVTADLEATENHNVKLREADEKTKQAKIDNGQQSINDASKVAGSLGSVAAAFGKKGAAAAKSSAIAQATIKTYEGATSAFSSLSGIPIIGPALGAAAAAAAVVSGLANVKRIKSTKYAGAFQDGGIVGGNSSTGDKLWAKVNSKEMILNQGQQANALAGMNSGGFGGLQLVVNNTGTPMDVTDYKLIDGRIEIAMQDAANIAINRVNESLATGQGETADALETRYLMEANL